MFERVRAAGDITKWQVDIAVGVGSAPDLRRYRIGVAHWDQVDLSRVPELPHVLEAAARQIEGSVKGARVLRNWLGYATLPAAVEGDRVAVIRGQEVATGRVKTSGGRGAWVELDEPATESYAGEGETPSLVTEPLDKLVLLVERS